MNIVLGEENVIALKDKFIVLELDSFKDTEKNEVVTAFCVLENIPFDELYKSEESIKIHNDMMDAYKSKDWDLCADLLTNLFGSWGSEMDSFYETLLDRVNQFMVMDKDLASSMCITISTTE